MSPEATHSLWGGHRNPYIRGWGGRLASSNSVVLAQIEYKFEGGFEAWVNIDSIRLELTQTDDTQTDVQDPTVAAQSSPGGPYKCFPHC